MINFDFRNYIVGFLLIFLTGFYAYHNMEVIILEKEVKAQKESLVDCESHIKLQNDAVERWQRENELKMLRLKKTDSQLKLKRIYSKKELMKLTTADIPEGCEDAVQWAITQSEIMGGK